MEDDPNPISDVPSYTIRTAAYVGDYETLKWFLRRHKKYLDEYLDTLSFLCSISLLQTFSSLSPIVI